MKKILKPAFLIAMTVVALASCKKEEAQAPANNNPGTPAPTKTQLITAKTWTVSSMTISPAMNGQSDITSMIEPCAKDDTWKFNASKNVTIDEGAQKCDMMGPQTKTKTWGFDGNEANITIGSDTYGLKEVSATSLKLTHTMQYNGTTYTVTEAFSGK